MSEYNQAKMDKIEAWITEISKKPKHEIIHALGCAKRTIKAHDTEIAGLKSALGDAQDKMCLGCEHARKSTELETANSTLKDLLKEAEGAMVNSKSELVESRKLLTKAPEDFHHAFHMIISAEKRITALLSRLKAAV